MVTPVTASELGVELPFRRWEGMSVESVDALLARFSLNIDSMASLMRHRFRTEDARAMLMASSWPSSINPMIVAGAALSNLATSVAEYHFISEPPRCW